MNPHPHPRRTPALVISALILTTITRLLAQGPLAPPSGPAPTMKTLDQVEARTPIPKGPATPIAGPHFIITEPGSYYLTSNIEVTGGDGIRINASNVSLDLNGFALISKNDTSSSGSAIIIGGSLTSIKIKNGSIIGGTVRTVSANGDVSFAPRGWLRGIRALLPTTGGFQLSHLTVEGCTDDAILIVSPQIGSLLDHITVINNEDDGLDANHCHMTNCKVENNGGLGIEAIEGTVTNCTVTGNGRGGIVATGGIVMNCTANDNDGNGIIANGGTVTNSTAKRNSGNDAFDAGIIADSVTNCVAFANSSTGISGACVTNCTANNNGGIGVLGTNGIVTNCRAVGNFRSGISVGTGVAAHCVASGNSTDTTTADKQIDVSAGGQRDTCVPATE